MFLVTVLKASSKINSNLVILVKNYLVSLIVCLN